jgi:hypothetical protein
MDPNANRPMNTTENSTELAEEMERQLRRISEVSGVGLEISLRIMLTVVTGLHDGLTHTVNNIPRDAGPSDLQGPAPFIAVGPAPFNIVGPAPANAVATTAAPIRLLAPAPAPFPAPFIQHQHLLTVRTPPLAHARVRTPSIGPLRTDMADEFYAVTVGRRIGVFRGPL